MLTDYHVHLRPDTDDTPAERYFTPENAARYRELATERGIGELGVAEHVYRFTAALDVWQHPFWRHNARDDLDAYCEFVREETSLALGIEGAIFRAVRGLVDHEARRGFQRMTGSWPGEKKPDPKGI